ncbi:MAG: prepilin-type N-terminal cleavage/methylation domain-containing protein [Gemmatimonadetes bacterium]|nr:MAG: prepilin-type N-terminal cleavage/methylation domain-containing protein [Gemmatimonadota bacterium]
MKRDQHQNGFSMIELVVVIAILGIMIAIGSPTYLKRLQTQRLDAAAEQIITHLHQAKQRATREHRPYRLNFGEYENGYYMERLNDNAEWEPVQAIGHDDAGNRGAGEYLLYLPPTVRVSYADTFVVFNNRGYAEPSSIQNMIEVSLPNTPRKKYISVSIAGFPKIAKEER